jgi:putative transposase
LKPSREQVRNNGQTYFVTSQTWERRSLFRSETWAKLFLNHLEANRGSGYLLHDFVVMPDHFHVILSPLGSLERSVQMIKGGFSFRAKKELGSNAEVWQRGFSDHRIRDYEDYLIHLRYIHGNPVRRGLCADAKGYAYSSVLRSDLDELPQWLKPLENSAVVRHG